MSKECSNCNGLGVDPDEKVGITCPICRGTGEEPMSPEDKVRKVMRETYLKFPLSNGNFCHNMILIDRDELFTWIENKLRELLELS